MSDARHADPEPEQGPESLIAQANRLVDQAQSGQACEAMATARRLISEGGEHPEPALFFSLAVGHDVLGDHGAAADAATAGIDAARREGQDGWRAACLAMRALQRIKEATLGGGSYDESQAIRDLAQAQVVVLAGIRETHQRIAAACNLAMAFTRLRLYEFAIPMHLEAARPTPESPADMPPEAKTISELNLAELHLVWTLELHHVGRTEEAVDHAHQALQHALVSEATAAGPHHLSWAARARLAAGCARAHLDAPLEAVEDVRLARLELDGVLSPRERSFTTPHIALALARAGRHDEGLALLDEEALPGHQDDSMVLAATQRARLVLMAPRSHGARVGLELSRTLSDALWRQRARRLSAAEAMVRYERLEVQHRAVRFESERDPLTGTAARRALDRRLELLGSRPAADDSPVCVLVVDLDRLKPVNDELGHQAGDLVLRRIGRALTAACRGGDMVGRYGGDEFVALLTADGDEGVAAATRMLTAVREVSWPAELTVRPSISIGLAVTDDHTSVREALTRADRAMYAAKRSGGDALVVAPSS